MTRPFAIGSGNASTWLGRAILLLFIGLPIAASTLYAAAYSTGMVGRFSQGFTVNYWQSTLADSRAMASLLFSLLIALIVTILVTTITLGTLLVCPTFQKSRMMLGVFLMLLGTPSLVLSQMTANMLGPGGWFSRFLYHLVRSNPQATFPCSSMTSGMWE